MAGNEWFDGWFSYGFAQRFKAAIQRYCEPENQNCSFEEALEIIADQVGVSVRTVDGWCRGGCNPQPSVCDLQVFCWETDTSVVWMIYGDNMTPLPLEKEARE